MGNQTGIDNLTHISGTIYQAHTLTQDVGELEKAEREASVYSAGVDKEEFESVGRIAFDILTIISVLEAGEKDILIVQEGGVQYNLMGIDYVKFLQFWADKKKN